MTTVFIGGSRRISRLSPQIEQRLDRIVDKNLPVLVGDANGADRAVQRYLHRKCYENVEVFCAGNDCRNNVGNWKLRCVPSNSRERNFNFYATKDRLMSKLATVGLMIWDGKSVGTLMNVSRLIRNNKKVVVYDALEIRFWELGSQPEWASFVARCDPELRGKVAEKVALEQRVEQSAGQTSLLTSGSQ